MIRTTHVSEHQTRQIRYTSDQLYKIGKTFYITKLNYTTANTIKSLGIRQTFRTNRNRQKKKKRKERRKWDTNQGIHRSLLIPLESNYRTLWNPLTSELMLTNIQSLKLKKNTILYYILQHKLNT